MTGRARVGKDAPAEQTDEQRQAAESLAADSSVQDRTEHAAAQATTDQTGQPLPHRNLLGQVIEPTPPPVQVLLSRVMGEVGHIAKERQVQEGPARFMYRGIEDVQKALQPLLVKHGLVILPTTLARIDHPVRTTKSGTAMYAVALHVRFTVYGPAGDHLKFDAWGEGSDTGDKGSGKAHSMAFKTAMLEALCIPTEADTYDADRTTPEHTYSTEQRERATAAWTAAMAAGDEPTLASVRARASALLDVPVEVEGSPLPLEQALRGRLQYLRGQAQQHQGDTGAGGAGGEQS